MTSTSAIVLSSPHGQSASDLAAVVGELYREGALSRSQVQAFARQPDMAPFLADVLGPAWDRRSAAVAC